MSAFETLAEALNDGFIAVNEHWHVTYLNRPARLLLRNPQLSDELTLQHLIPDDPSTNTWRELHRASKQKITTEVDVFFPAFFSWLEVRAFPLDGGVGLILRDITDRQWLLRKEAERGYLRNIFQAAPVALYLTRGPEHVFEYSNDFARQLINNRDIEGHALRAAFPDIEGQGFYELFDQVYRTGEVVEITEARAQLTDPYTGTQQELYINASYIPLRGFDAQISGVLGLVVDVTQYVEARKESERLAEEHAAVLTHLQEGVIVADSQGRLIFVNDVAAELHGVKVLDITPEAYTETYHLLTVDGQPHPEDELPLVRALRQGEVVREAHWRIQRPDGDIILVSGAANPVFTSDGSRAGAVLTLRQVKQADHA